MPPPAPTPLPRLGWLQHHHPALAGSNNTTTPPWLAPTPRSVWLDQARKIFLGLVKQSYTDMAVQGIMDNTSCTTSLAFDLQVVPGDVAPGHEASAQGGRGYTGEVVWRHGREVGSVVGGVGSVVGGLGLEGWGQWVGEWSQCLRVGG